jgi:hypothetical protein
MSADSAVLDPPRNETAHDWDNEDAPEQAGGPSDQPDDQPSAELVIEAGGQVSLLVGGETPDQSTVVLRGGEVNVNGEFEKGSRLKFEIEGVVSEITFTDLMDQKTGEVTGTKRKHVLKIRGIQAVEG